MATVQWLWCMEQVAEQGTVTVNGTVSPSHWTSSSMNATNHQSLGFVDAEVFDSTAMCSAAKSLRMEKLSFSFLLLTRLDWS